MKRQLTNEKPACQLGQQSSSCETSNDYFVYPPISNPPMNEQSVVPPPHIWSRIEKILDTQEQKKSLAESPANRYFPLMLPIDKLPKIYQPFALNYLA